MTVLTSQHYSGHDKATEEEDDPGTLGEEIWRRKCNDRLQVELEEHGGGRSRQRWMESNGMWTVIHWVHQGISQVKAVDSVKLAQSVYKIMFINFHDAHTD